MTKKNYEYRDQRQQDSYPERLKRSNERSRIENKVMKQIKEDHNDLYQKIRAGVVKEFEIEKVES